MIGKANEDFLDWIVDKYFIKGITFSELNIYQKGDVGQFLRFPTTKNAYIIEWFDSVEIYIRVTPNIDEGFPVFYSSVEFLQDLRIASVMVEFTTGQYYTDSRQKATIGAITKANEIYNERYGK